jgi:hypothetical protein
VCQLEPADVERGRELNRAAIDLFARCCDAGVWPGYDGINNIGLPGWARAQIDADLRDTGQGM